MRIFKSTDRAEIDFKGVTFVVAPLTYGQKAEAINYLDESPESVILMVGTVIKYGLKEVRGATDTSGNPYNLSFEEDGSLTLECLNQVLCSDADELMGQIAGQMVKKPLPEKVYGNGGEPLPGVEVKLVPGK